MGYVNSIPLLLRFRCAALDQALQEVVRDGPAISLFVQAQLLMHLFEQLPGDDGRHGDRDPLLAIP